MKAGTRSGASLVALALGAGAAHACPICGIGGRDAWSFILVVVGSFLVGAAFLLAWSISSGHFRDAARVSRRVLELDHTTGVRR